MEEKKEKRGHRLTIDDRRRGTISGITDVLAFDEKEILLETEQGNLEVKGRELHISRLTLERGELDLEGMVDSMNYSSGGGKHARRGNLWKRLLQ